MIVDRRQYGFTSFEMCNVRYITTTPNAELEVIEAVTSSYPPWAQKLFVASNIKTIQDALSVLNKLEAIEGQHPNPQQWSNRNRPHARSSYDREDHRDGRARSARQTYVSREQRCTRNSRYPEQEGYDIQETYMRSGSNRRNYSLPRNMTNASTPNAEATPYNEARNSRKVRWITGRETSDEQSRGPYAVHIREIRRSGKFSSGTY
jgi:hypothetical protein